MRAAGPDDVPALAALHVETWRAAYRGIMPDALLDGLSVAVFAGHWSGHLARATRTDLVCDDGGRVIGFAAFGPARDPDVDARDVAELYGIYVHPEQWGRRAGWMLWTASATALREQGRREVVPWVLEANARARRFYERVGFTVDAGARKAVEREGASIPEVRYRLRLRAAG